MSTNAPPPQEPPSTPSEGSSTPESPASAAPEPPDPTRRACPKCGAQNPTSASFCWQCLTTLAAGYATPGRGPASPTGAPVLPVPPGASSGPLGGPRTSTFGQNTYENRQPVTNELDSVVPLPASRPRSTLGAVLRIAVPLVFAVGGFFIGWRLLSGGITIPETLVGIPIREDPQSLQVVSLLEESMERLGFTARVALYGEATAPSPSVLLVVIDDVPEQDPNSLFQQFGTGLAQSGTGSIEPGDVQRRDFEGVTYLCAPTNTELQAVCMWQFDSRLGFVGSFDRDLLGTFQLTIAAQEKISG